MTCPVVPVRAGKIVVVVFSSVRLVSNSSIRVCAQQCCFSSSAMALKEDGNYNIFVLKLQRHC